MQTLDIMILCKVVDNFGDIGFVYRLARALTNLCNGESDVLFSFSGNAPKTSDCSLNLRIVADNLESFSLLEPKINPKLDSQKISLSFNEQKTDSGKINEQKIDAEKNTEKNAEKTEVGLKIFNWNADSVCLDEFRKNPPQIILECFQCGRPEWLENLLFTEKVPNIVNIIMIDYLTAEPYAETFHKLKSLTRSVRVQKVNFMPGFTEKTGGLVLNRKSEIGNRNVEPEIFGAIMFGYPRDYSPVVRSLAKFGKMLESNGKNLNILLARGAGFDSFKKACSYETGNRNDEIGVGNANCELKKQKAFLKEQKTLLKTEKTFPFLLKELPFLPQTEWDSLLFDSPLLFVRGEDSLSRACLSGVPFVWHAYPQSEEYQLVKVNALLEQMKPHFSADDFCVLQKCWQIYNADDVPPEEVENALDSFLQKYGSLCAGFKSFSESLVKNGDFAEHLLDFVFEILQERAE